MNELPGSDAGREGQRGEGLSQASVPLYWVAETGRAIELSIHQPSLFITQNLERVIPDWHGAALWVVLVLQQSRYDLQERTPCAEREKEYLRERFLRFGFEVTLTLREQGYLSNLFDPRTGYPLLSRPGEIPHDDTAAVGALLGFPLIRNTCTLIEHPRWGTAVYPSTLLTAAPPPITRSLLQWVARQQGWYKPGTATALR